MYLENFFAEAHPHFRTRRHFLRQICQAVMCLNEFVYVD